MGMTPFTGKLQFSGTFGGDRTSRLKRDNTGWLELEYETNHNVIKGCAMKSYKFWN